MKAVFRKTSTGIHPIDECSLELFDKIEDSELVMVEFIKKRNYLNHKRFFKMVDVCFEMQEFFDNKEVFRKHLTMIAGHFDEIVVPDNEGGTTLQYWPKSLEFQKMFRRCITGFISRYGKGITEKELMRVIEFD